MNKHREFIHSVKDGITYIDDGYIHHYFEGEGKDILDPCFIVDECVSVLENNNFEVDFATTNVIYGSACAGSSGAIRAIATMLGFDVHAFDCIANEWIASVEGTPRKDSITFEELKKMINEVEK